MSNSIFIPARRMAGAAALVVTLLLGHAASAQSVSSVPVSSPNPGVMAPAGDIHDIRGPKPIAAPWLVPLLAATVLLAMGGAYAVWVWNRRRYRAASERPLDIALQRLEKARVLMIPQRGRDFSIEVSSAVRDYIGGRFGLLAAHLTTDEFLHRLLEPVDSILATHRSLLDNFLQTCDLAKFGGWDLAAADMEGMLQSAREFIVTSSAEERRSPTNAAFPTAANLSGASTARETYVSLPST